MPDIHRFVKMFNAFRQRRDVVTEEAVLSLNELLRRAQIDVARRGARATGLGRLLACAGVHAAKPARALSPSRHAQCLLGAADVRATRRCRQPSQSGGAASTLPVRLRTTSSSGSGAADRTSPPTYLAQPRSVAALALALAGNRLSWRRNRGHSCYRKNWKRSTADETPLVTNELQLMDAYLAGMQLPVSRDDLPEGQSAAETSRCKPST